MKLAMTKEVVKIAFFVSRYSRTGVPLAQLRLASALARRGHTVEYIVGFLPDELSIPSVDGVAIVVLNKSRTIAMFPPLVKYLVSTKPDIVFSAEDHMNAITAFAAIASRSKCKISASSRITPKRVYTSRSGLRPKIDALLHRLARGRIDVLACVSSEMAGEYEELFGGGRYCTVYNIIQDENSASRISEALDDPWITESSVPVVVSAGTLTKRKGLDVLIKSIAIVCSTRPVKLVILGEGHQRKVLEELIEGLGLRDSVRFFGAVENPLKYFRYSDVFVLSSYAEGLPNVLVEAMSAGCTVVSTKCPTGPAEVLQDGKYGYIVPMGDHVAMAASILEALDHPIADDLLKEAVAPFTEPAVIARHRELLGF